MFWLVTMDHTFVKGLVFCVLSFSIFCLFELVLEVESSILLMLGYDIRLLGRVRFCRENGYGGEDSSPAVLVGHFRFTSFSEQELV